MLRTAFFKATALSLLIYIYFSQGLAAAQNADAGELRERGRSALGRGEFREAEHWFHVALEQLERDQAPPHDVAEVLGDLATDLLSQEKYSEAEDSLNRAIS